ncbi:MAG: hypothetical protein PHE27_08080 [Alphaproteobacteria bacterium]|nr:hypothetical protein [Alphaproteobacteria bacterium]
MTVRPFRPSRPGVPPSISACAPQIERIRKDVGIAAEEPPKPDIPPQPPKFLFYSAALDTQKPDGAKQNRNVICNAKGELLIFTEISEKPRSRYPGSIFVGAVDMSKVVYLEDDFGELAEDVIDLTMKTQRYTPKQKDNVWNALDEYSRGVLRPRPADGNRPKKRLNPAP